MVLCCFPVDKLGTISYNENDRSSPAFWGLEDFPEDFFGVVHALLCCSVPAPALVWLNLLHIVQPQAKICRH